jgi:hypothetical protein
VDLWSFWRLNSAVLLASPEGKRGQPTRMGSVITDPGGPSSSVSTETGSSPKALERRGLHDHPGTRGLGNEPHRVPCWRVWTSAPLS